MQPAVQVEPLGDVLFVSWRGKIIFGDEPESISKSIRRQYPRYYNIIVNLQDIELSAGDVPVLLVHYLSAYAAGYRLRFCSASENVQRVLESTRVVEVFDLPIDDTMEESLTAFRYRYGTPIRRAHAASAF